MSIWKILSRTLGLIMADLMIFYVVGTLVGFWLSRKFWMVRGAAKCYDIMREKKRNER